MVKILNLNININLFYVTKNESIFLILSKKRREEKYFKIQFLVLWAKRTQKIKQGY